MQATEDTACRVPDLAAIIRGDEPLAIPVRNRGKVIATLRPLTRAALADAALLEKLARWRNEHREWFLSQFEAKAADTRQWLEQTVLTDDTRLIFLIEVEGREAGTIGFLHLTPTSAELERLILGERGGPPALILASEAALLRWLFTSFRIARVEAIVLAGNFTALQLHRSLGFRIEEKVPLRAVQTENGSVLVECEETAAETAKFRMVLERQAFVDEESGDAAE